MIRQRQWNNVKSEKLYKLWLESGDVFSSCEDDYKEIRDTLFLKYESIKEEIQSEKSKYAFDFLFGLELYEYFQPEKNGFTLDMAEDIQFWSYLGMKVIPEIVYERWPNLEKNSNRFHSKPNRVWLNQIWWYIHLSWTGDKNSTKELLRSDSFTTDTIMNLVDRSGSKGFYVDSYRKIMKEVSFVDNETLQKKGISKEDFFRNVMKLNTSKLIMFEPLLYKGGTDGYVKSLITEAI